MDYSDTKMLDNNKVYKFITEFTTISEALQKKSIVGYSIRENFVIFNWYHLPDKFNIELIHDNRSYKGYAIIKKSYSYNNRNLNDYEITKNDIKIEKEFTFELPIRYDVDNEITIYFYLYRIYTRRFFP